MIDIRDHGGTFGGGARQKGMKYTGAVALTHYDTGNMRFVPAKDYAYTANNGSNAFSVVNLATNTLYGNFTPAKPPVFMKASGYDDNLLGFNNGLVMYNKNMGIIWDKGTADYSNYVNWPSVCIGKNHIYYLSTYDYKIYKINKATGARVAVTTATFSNIYNASLNVNEDETELYYTTTSNGQLSINIINASTMALTKTALGSASGDQTLGTFKKGNICYVAYQSSGVRLITIDIGPTTPVVQSDRKIGDYNLYIDDNSQATQVYKDGMVINMGPSGNFTYFMEPTDSGHIMHSPEYISGGQMKMTDKRWIQQGYDGKLYHGTFS